MDAPDLCRAGCTCGRVFGPGKPSDVRGRHSCHAKSMRENRDALARDAALEAQGTAQAPPGEAPSLDW